MNLVFFAAVISLIVTVLTIPLLIKHSYTKNMFDLPSRLKSHKYPVSFFGGVGIYLAIVLSMTIILPSHYAHWLQYLLASSMIVFLLGLYDDIVFLTPLKKFGGQLLAISIIVEQGQFHITSLYGFLGINEMNVIGSHVFTYLTFLLIINAYNLIDGVDGLAGTLTLISSIFFGVVFLNNNNIVFASLSFSVASAISIFLVFNYSPPKIFMGDNGSMVIGLINALLVVQFINLETTNGILFHSNTAPAIGMAVLFIPIIDTIRLMVLRIIKGKSPFVGDNNHIHHLLLRRGFSHMKTTFILSISNAFVIFYAILFRSFGLTFLVFSMVVIFFLMLKLLLTNSSVNDFSESDTLPSMKGQPLSDKNITPDGEIVASSEEN
jgi:UDP-N-acetylmuramyl pentapeptide phosphotransferase/UDP-N-acetylglucosamine-1-phosphate transferase